MRTRPPFACSDPDFFRALEPAHSASEARTLILAAYSEEELAPERAARVRFHVGSCNSCAQMLADFDEPAGTAVVASAVCPSSEVLDRYLFDRVSVAANEAARIERHLSECSLCREECQWLKDLESSQAVEFRKPTGSWSRHLLTAAAVAALALAAFLFWRANPKQPNADQLKALAVIKDPEQIDYAELELTSPTLDSSTQAQYADAVDDFKQGRFEQASAGFERVLQKAPGHSGALFLLGYSYYKINQPEKAFALCDRAEGMKPHAYERCMFLVHIALKTGNFRRAFVEISAMYHEAPQVPEIRDMYQKITALIPDHKKI